MILPKPDANLVTKSDQNFDPTTNYFCRSFIHEKTDMEFDQIFPGNVKKKLLFVKALRNQLLFHDKTINSIPFELKVNN